MYKIKEYDYRKYLELRGTREMNKPFALELRDHNTRYFVIEKNDEFFDDFGIYENSYYLNLNRNNFKDRELMESIKKYLQEEGYEYVEVFIPLNNVNDYFNEPENYSVIKETFNNIIEDDYHENDINYKKMRLYL